MSDEDVSALTKRFTAATLTTEQLEALPPPRWLIDKLVPLDAVSVPYGPPGARKSFVVVDWALHVATGSWWNGRETVAGPVVYIVAESAAGMGQRVTAWRKHHGIHDMAAHHPVHWLTLPPNLLSTGSAAAFLNYVRPHNPVMVVVDTLARCSTGADENTARDMGVILDNLEAVRRATGAACVAVHHSGKDRASGARGSTALQGGVGAEIEVQKDDMRVTLKVTKQKDAAEEPPIRLVSLVVDLGTDDKGKPVTSLVLVPDAGSAAASAPKLTRSGTTMLETLRTIEVPGGISTSVWLKACEGIAERTFYDQRPRLLEADLVRNVGTERAPKYLTAERDDEDAS